MILNKKDEEFDYCFRVRVDDFDYILFATSATVKCFGCGEEGHLIKACPSRGAPAPPGATADTAAVAAATTVAAKLPAPVAEQAASGAG